MNSEDLALIVQTCVWTMIILYTVTMAYILLKQLKKDPVTCTLINRKEQTEEPYARPSEELPIDTGEGEIVASAAYRISNEREIELWEDATAKSEQYVEKFMHSIVYPAIRQAALRGDYYVCIYKNATVLSDDNGVFIELNDHTRSEIYHDAAHFLEQKGYVVDIGVDSSYLQCRWERANIF